MESLLATYRDDEELSEEEDTELINIPINQNPESNNSDANSDELLSEDENELSDSLQQPQTQRSPEEIPPLKKHKPISPESPNSIVTPTPISNKSKKKKSKSNSVWAKPTRKTKKKPKPNGNQQVLAEKKSVQIPPTLPRILDKTDDSPDMKICLSKLHKAEKVELSDDRMSAGSSKGYRMVRATRGVTTGAWYYEIKVEKLGETGHTRLGWSTDKGDLQAPVGYDVNSFGYRDIDGSKIHKAMREKYGEGGGYVEGDVIGCYISLPEGDLYAPKMGNWVVYKGQNYACPGNGKEEPDKVVPGSEISFFKNGACQGVAFKDINGGCYYPAASMYTLPNQPNCEVKFNFGPDFEFFPDDFGDHPLPTPMIEVPYHVFDSIVENTETTEEKTQQNS